MDSRIREALEKLADPMTGYCSESGRGIARALLTADPEPPNECPYCGPDGTQYHGDSERVCPHCGGSHIAEPEPCEDARKVAAQVSAVFGVSRLQVGGDPGNDPTLDLATEAIAAYASQVADKRAEELRAQVKTLREAIIDAIHSSSNSYKDGLGRMHSLEGEDGEQSRILSFDGFNGLEIALAATEPKP